MRRYWAVIVVVCGMLGAEEKLRTLRPGFNLFSPEQDVQLGKEAAAEVQKTKPIVRNTQLDTYINQLGQKLAGSRRAGKFPFSFQVVSDSSINAFALPGGPMFINTQTFLAAQNEAQLAGVMAHEMSHVALRHGTHEASKGQALQIISGMAGSVAGQGIFGKMAQAGIGLGANSLLLHYSRSAEAEADYNGAQIMADAGYDPHYLAQFFQQLETRSSEGALAQFMSDHPTPGNRVKAVDDEVRLMPPQNYVSDSPQFHDIQALVRRLPPPPAPKPQ